MRKHGWMGKALLPALVLPILLSGCAQGMQAAEAGNAASGNKVLIAGTSSGFKEKVAEGLLKRLGTQDYYFRIIGLDALESQDTSAFGAVLLVNTCMAGKAGGKVSRFLAKDPANPKVIVFTTRGGEGKPVDFGVSDVKVDAVSAVSPSGNAEKAADDLAALIKARFRAP
jgi:hypothetical protein